MKFLPLIWAGLWRKPARTLLTLLCVVIAFVLFGLLQGVDFAFARIIGQQKLDRMFVDPRFDQPVPLSYKAQVEKVKGITRITEVHFMGGYYQDRKNGLGVIFTRPAIWLAIRPEVGGEESRQMLANYAYLDEARASGSGEVSRFLLRIDDAAHAARIAREIDAHFANSSVATRTQSEQDQAQSSLAQIGDFKFFTRAIMSAVFFALLFLTLNTTMESVRERTGEFATLKTLGFSDTNVLALVLAESVLLFVVAALIGLSLAAALLPLARSFIGVVAIVSPAVVIYGAVLAITAAVLSAIVPAWRAKRLSIVQALAVR